MSYPPPPPPPPPPFSASWYRFEPCCGGNPVYFRFDGTTNAPNEGISIYTGPAAIGYEPMDGLFIPLVNNQCYRIYRGNATDPTSLIDGSNYGNLEVVPTFTPSNYTWDDTTSYETECGDESPGFCPDCITPCYTLFSCDQNLPPITVDNDLSAYLGLSISVQVDADGTDNCYFVTQAIGCENAITAFGVLGDCGNCGCECYEIFGTGKLSYVDCDLAPQSIMVNGYWKGCSYTYPFTSPVLTTFEKGKCEENGCNAGCYQLKDCQGILEPIYSTVASLSPFATLGQIVQIEGYDNCWEIGYATESYNCECAINVVVLQVYDRCKECKPNPNYKLTNCDDPTTIAYTSDDLSLYVGQVVRRSDCKTCWLIEEVNGPIPSDAPISVDSAYDDCEACKTTYYQLTDCAGVQEPIITTTDLSDYLGSVIKLEWCPNTCWDVNSYFYEPRAGIVGNILDSYGYCAECLDTLPCICIRITNHDTVSHNYNYLACNYERKIITILPGERSDRRCMISLNSSYPTDYIETFGDCVDGKCPPEISPKRTVRPGYSTPICSTDKYEKITCKSAEILYKQVLNLRYGISNCCPDEDSKWLLKKEIIDLQALVDPDYTCMPNTCDCGAASCGCGTNSCNSH